MKGKVLGFSKYNGVILGEDEKRHKFTLEDWRENIPPLKGAEVDFETDGENAKDIYLLEAQSISIPKEKKEILSQAGLFAGIGIIILYLFTWIPEIGPIIALAGAVMLFIGVYKISELAPEKEIFKNFLFAYLLIPFVIIGGGIVVFVIIFQTDPYTYHDNTFDYFARLILWILTIPMFVFQANYARKSFLGIYEATGVPLFETTAKILYWGSLLSPIIIGIFIAFVGWIVAAVAFFSLRK